jgi:8-oxo-dGTP pyrophosphatase MutT (NUDIX family)
MLRCARPKRRPDVPGPIRHPLAETDCNRRTNLTMKKNNARRQIAALPYRRTACGKLEVLLISTRGKHHWIIPKGWPLKRHAHCLCAAREAFEEAGVRGCIETEPLGRFNHTKRGGALRCVVEVFPLEVKHRSKKWPERRARRSVWLEPSKAAELVQATELRDLLSKLESLSAE